MGAWSVSITGNDTARDLRTEYSVAFFCYDVYEAVQKIDVYVRNEMFDESDPEEWCDYYYSLADYMWKKGILTDEVRQTAINMIDSGFGLEIWAESGKKVLEKRKSVLDIFKKQILSPMPSKKKIKLDVYLKPVFETGDIIALQLQTVGKKYTENNEKPVSNVDFEAYDGKYILIQKIKDHSSWSSSINPEIQDYWAIFRLFDGTYDDIPANLNISELKDSQIRCVQGITPLFLCESSMSYFKKRKYQIICNNKTDIEKFDDTSYESIFLGINKPWSNPDSSFLAAMGKGIEYSSIIAIDEEISNLINKINRWSRFNYNISREENEKIFRDEKCEIINTLENVLTSGGSIYSISFGRIIGICAVLNHVIKYVGIDGRYRKNGFGTALLRYAKKCEGNEIQFSAVNDGGHFRHICEKTGIKWIDN